MLRTLAIANYRSLRQLLVPLGQRPQRALILDKELGETRIANLEPHEVPGWQWPGR